MKYKIVRHPRCMVGTQECLGTRRSSVREKNAVFNYSKIHDHQRQPKQSNILVPSQENETKNGLIAVDDV